MVEIGVGAIGKEILYHFQALKINSYAAIVIMRSGLPCIEERDLHECVAYMAIGPIDRPAMG